MKQATVAKNIYLLYQISGSFHACLKNLVRDCEKIYFPIVCGEIFMGKVFQIVRGNISFNLF